ncbi:MAG: OmpA family protein [Proteobacteria bacterium]|nr:OmpA family protein [Desulfobulbaceae bacterium]MBU4152046.1 OmpA family protein [Pseudomonadota bacterium]
MKRSKSYHRLMLASCGLAVLLMSGCATTKENVALTNARETFNNAQSNPDVNRYAPLELQDAKRAIEQAENSLTAGEQNAQIEHLAYLAKQKAAIASEVAAMKKTDKELESASADRNKALLVGRTREAEHSFNKAEIARQEAENQRKEAENQRLAAEEALKEAQQKSLEAEQARQEAAAAEARAKKLEAEVADLQAKKTERGLVLTLGDVLFDTGKSDLKTGAYTTIEKLTTFLKEYPSRKIQIEGFTDSVGADEYNLGLSMHRAEAVRNALNGRGIELDRILYRGYGEMYPIASNDSAVGRQLNRRVEIIISDENGVIPARNR